MHPPNIHEIERVLLLRQALDILEASEDVQRSLYPDDLDPATEMTTLFRDAWHGVRRVFTPILPKDVVARLDGLDEALDDAPPAWDRIREEASGVRAIFPNLGERQTPRAYRDQIVLGEHHLQHRWQRDESAS